MYSEQKTKAAYESPACETAVISNDKIICGSPVSGRIDDFDDSDFNW